LIAPFRLSAHAGGLGLHDLRFLLGFGVQAIKWNDAQGLVEKAWIFVFGWCHGKSLE
jgi:hypothetical protein